MGIITNLHTLKEFKIYEPKFKKIGFRLTTTKFEEGTMISALVGNMACATAFIEDSNASNVAMYLDELYNKCIRMKELYGNDFEFAMVALATTNETITAMLSLLVSTYENKRLMKIFLEDETDDERDFTNKRLNVRVFDHGVVSYDITNKNDHLALSVLGGLVQVDLEPSMISNKSNNQFKNLKRTSIAITKEIIEHIEKLNMSQYSDLAQSYAEFMKYCHLFNISFNNQIIKDNVTTVSVPNKFLISSHGDDMFIINGLVISAGDANSDSPEAKMTFNKYNQYDKYEEFMSSTVSTIVETKIRKEQEEAEARAHARKLKLEAAKKEQQKLMERQRLAVIEAERFNVPWFKTNKLAFDKNFENYEPDDIDFIDPIMGNDWSAVESAISSVTKFYKLKAIQGNLLINEYEIVKKMPNRYITKIVVDKNNYPYHKSIFVDGMIATYMPKRNKDGILQLGYTYVKDGKVIESGFINDGNDVLRIVTDKYHYSGCLI